MSSLDDLDDSNLFCKSIIQKRKAGGNNNPKSAKQIKLSFSQTKQRSQNEEISGTNSNINESLSSYFSTERPSNICPLCSKVFKGDSVYSTHMKQCAKAHKMTTKQLLEALELQKKKIQERKELGICSQNLLPAKKIISKPKVQDTESYDLALGIALSKSLVRDVTASTDMQKTTLEEFGFTSGNTIQRSWRKKNESNKKFVLKERTAEERQRIIVEKVALVLLDEEEKKDVDRKLNQTLTCQKTQKLKLWDLGENNEKSVWYVDQIKTLMLSDQEISEETAEPGLPDNINDEIIKLNLPQKDTLQCWKKMINNSFKSDLVLKAKNDEDVYLHSLVLYTRCAEASEQDYNSVFQKYNVSTVMIFLEFLYCGTLNSLIRSEVDDLFNLASEVCFDELITVLNCLKNLLIQQAKLIHCENKENTPDVIVDEKLETSEKDLFTDDVDVSQTVHKSKNEDDKNASENESNAEKSYWSFIQHEKEREKLKEVNRSEEKTNLILSTNVARMEVVETSLILRESEEILTKEKFSRALSDDSATKDLEFQNGDDKISTDCIVLSSDSESKDNFVESQRDRSKTLSPIATEIPHFDPYDNFHCFSEEQFSPVGLHSQSLLTGDVSAESLKSSNTPQANSKPLEEEPQRTVGYCSTPLAVRRTIKIKSCGRNSVEKSKNNRGDLSASRIVRKSLNLHSRKSNSCKMLKRKSCKKFAEELANSIVEELSKSSAFNSSFVRVESAESIGSKKFVEITPVSNSGEFGEAITPYPNYSLMGETMLKEQLTKYGLKRTLAKSKARKILRHIYEELHPFYNTKTGKILKMLPENTPKSVKKSKPKNVKAKQSRNSPFENKRKRRGKNQLNSSNNLEEMLDASHEKLADDSGESEFDDLNETLTQSTPSNPVDLPSAFSEYLRSNPDYHQKILLYEPIWLEELQRRLKEAFKKHFKISAIMNFLDQKCITFRSEAQAKKLQEKYKKGNSKKVKDPSR